MIEFTRAYVANGKTYATLEEAQWAELSQLFDPKVQWEPGLIAKGIADQKEKILDILTTTESSKPRARAINGGRKPRKAKSQATLPLIPEGGEGKAA